MNHIISDLEQRKLALEPTQSFIVQAPAGSGKTSLLVHRYLTLLAKVNAPEEIVAITFTRKAAFEMRNRIINALQQATKDIPAQDQQLAMAALNKDRAKEWNIIQNPTRLRIQTIDSFCNYLVKRVPIVTKSSNASKIVQGQEADIYYRETARIVLESSTEPEYAEYLENLLLHLDNDWHLAENLFIAMLKSREQWLPHIVGLKNVKELRQNMELALQIILQENLERCFHLFPKELQQEFSLLLNFSKDNYEKPPSFLQQIDIADGFCKMELSNWQGIAGILLTKEFSWRKKVTKEHGFPAQASGNIKEEKELFKSMKVRMEELLLKFGKHENFRTSLENLLCSPPPNYDNQQWQIIEALLKLLPLLAAQLKVLFNERGVTDYAEISMAALRALGDNDLPSELALNLDYRIQHILIDEFQDTSVAQYRLIEKLITTWQQDDGRTLFIVGDPMQSIYRFREAEVGLFLRAQYEGIGALKLHPLTLTTNFRSCENIIKWVNVNFSKIFPVIADIGFGAVPFRSSVAVKQDQNAQVKIELLKNADTTAEAMHVISIVQELQQQNSEASIAILVKARNHLQKIIAALHRTSLKYQAYELETLGESIVVRDLHALTRALFHPADRIAWLAILRAPWCGLQLRDLYQVANGSSKLIWDNICNFHELNLSDDGKERVAKLRQILVSIIARCGRIPWNELVEEAWLLLGGPATVNDELELEHAKAYLELLSSHPFDIEIIQKKLFELYAPSTQTARIQIMTIHKAKGLEFDHVVIPGIDRTTRFDDHKLMLWFERPELYRGSSLLLAPIRASGGELDQVYQYLRLVERKKGFYEIGRLLYVALTRAKKSAHIIGCVKNASFQENSLLKQLEPCFSEDWIIDKFATTDNDSPVSGKARSPLTLRRLSKDWLAPDARDNLATITPTWQIVDNQSAIIGTVIHYCLRRISEGESPHKSHWRKLLQQLGYTNIESGIQVIGEAIELTLADKRGQWILANHAEAESELAITTTIINKFENFIIDRTFVDKDGVRWIIDYKTSQPDKKNITEFLFQERAKYAPQLLRYVTIMRELDQIRPIKSGLYFPMFGGWIEF